MSSILHGSILPSPNQELQQPFTGDEISIRVPMHAARFFSPFFPSYHLISLPNDISEVSPTRTLPILSLNVLLLSALELSPVDTPHSFCTHLHSRSSIETEELALSKISAGSRIFRGNVDWKERFPSFQPSLRHIARSTTHAKSAAVPLKRSSLVYISLDEERKLRLSVRKKVKMLKDDVLLSCCGHPHCMIERERDVHHED